MMGRKSCGLSRSSTHVLDILFTNIPPDSAFHLPTCKPGSPLCIDQASSQGWPLGEPAGDQTLHFYPSLKSLNSFPKSTSSHLFKLSEKYFLNLPSLEMLLQTMSSQSYQVRELFSFYPEVYICDIHNKNPYCIALKGMFKIICSTCNCALVPPGIITETIKFLCLFLYSPCQHTSMIK